MVAHKDKIVGLAQWPAILDRSIWERERVKLGDVSEKRTRRLLSGLLYCAECGKVSRKIETLDELVVSAQVNHMRAETGG